MNKKILMEELYPIIEEIMESDGSVTFTVSGVSMQPMLYNNRDTVTLVKPKFPLKKYDLPFYRTDDGKFVMHRVIKVHKNGTYTCRGDNCWNIETPICENEIIGVVKYFTRKNKLFDVDKSFGYLLYIRTWSLLHHFKKYYKFIYAINKKLKILHRRFNETFLPEKSSYTRRDGSVKTITYRRARKSDLPHIQELIIQHADYEINMLNNILLNRSWSKSKGGKKYYETVIEKHYMQIALCDAKIIGYFIGVINNKKYENFPVGVCKGVFVDPQYRGGGIASNLLKSFKKYCLENGCDCIKIEYLAENTPAEKLYKNNGFKIHSKTVICDLKEKK